MKLIELFENENKVITDEQVQLIKTNCKPYLKTIYSDVLEHSLYRGVAQGSSNFGKYKVDMARKPRNMTEEFHKVSDTWFERKFGSKFRSQAVFCTGDKKQASGYGKLYYIFPIGNLKFVWSPKIKDLIEHEIAYFEDDYGNFEEYRQDVFMELDDYGYINKDMPGAIGSGSEIMIHCKEIYSVAYTKENAEMLQDRL